MPRCFVSSAVSEEVVILSFSPYKMKHHDRMKHGGQISSNSGNPDLIRRAILLFFFFFRRAILEVQILLSTYSKPVCVSS